MEVKQDYLNEIANNISDMEVVKVPEGKIKKVSLIDLRCKQNPDHYFTISVQQALKLSKCKMCSGRYIFSEEEQVKRLNLLAEMKFLGFEGKYKDSHTKCLMQCTKDDYTWTATINSLVNRGTGCPKCKGNAQYSFDELVSNINTFPFFEFIEFPEGYNSIKSKITVKCKKHDVTWTSTAWTANSGMTGCKICKYEKIREKRKTPEALVIKKINDLENITFIDFSDNYLNAYSKVKVQCSIHDFEWEASIDNLMNGRGCPKCGNVYKYSTEERLKQIGDIPDIDFVEILEGNTHAKSKIKLRCRLDGYEWITTVEPLLNGSGCPRCSYNSADLKDLLEHPEIWTKRRCLYYIKIEHSSFGVFWKVGLSKSADLKSRYAINVLNKDNIKIIDECVIELTNIDAVLSEYYIVRKFSDFWLDATGVMIKSKGGTECFSVDILRDTTLESLVMEAISKKSDIISTVKTTKFFKKETARRKKKGELSR